MINVDFILRLIIVIIEAIVFSYGVISIAKSNVKENMGSIFTMLFIYIVSFLLLSKFAIIFILPSAVFVFSKEINIRLIKSFKYVILTLVVMICVESISAFVFETVILNNKYIVTFVISIMAKTIEVLLYYSFKNDILKHIINKIRGANHGVNTMGFKWRKIHK